MIRPLQIALTVCLFVLAGCGVPEATGKILKVIADPDVPVGEMAEQPTKVELHVYAAAEMNPNFENEPAPIVVNVYALSSDHRFFGYDFFSLVEEPDEALGITLLEVLDENMLEPDSYKVLGPYELPAKTRKIGIIAQYLDIETAVWRDTIEVAAVGDQTKLLVLLLEEEVRVIEDDR